MGVNNQDADVKCKVSTSEIWHCIRKRRFQICYECEDFPCGHFSWIKEKNPAKLKDYERFRKLGLEEWLRIHEQENRLNP